MYTFLTGSTGLLGRYVVRDLLLAGFPVCVLVRGSRRESAADRVETIMQRWERLLGRRLPRPVVASGHLNDPQLGLSKDDAQWVKNNCRRVVHCAASLKFVPEENGEPSRTNIDGTKNLLNFCQWAGIRELHHVSSAYVAGLLNDSVLPTDLNVAESWTNNAYLGSKSVAEEMVRDNKFAESLTIYRPSMIVGDSDTGYTNTYHGFYTPLQFGHVMAPKFPAVGTIDRLNFLDLLGLSGQEHKNLVPVDWVSAAMVEIIRTPRLHGASYHLTHPRPITARQMQDIFLEVLIPLLGRDFRGTEPPGWTEARAAFQEQMRIYQAYWRNDPVFDRTGTDRVLSHVAIPEMDMPRVRLLARWAVENNFGWRAEPRVPYDRRLQSCFELLERQPRAIDSPADGPSRVAAQVTGPGGGDWHFVVERGQLRAGGRGITADANLTLYATAQTLSEIAQQGLSPRVALAEGRAVALGQNYSADQLTTVLQSVANARAAQTAAVA